MSISKVCAETMTHCDGDAHLGHYYLNRRHADVFTSWRDTVRSTSVYACKVYHQASALPRNFKKRNDV